MSNISLPPPPPTLGAADVLLILPALALSTCVSFGSAWGRGVKSENLWNKKAQNQLCWLTTHEGWKQQNKAEARRFFSMDNLWGGG